MKIKKKVILEEIIEYLPYDIRLTDKQKSEFILCVEQGIDISHEWMRVIYDYFYSHITCDGNIVSLENYLLVNKLDDNLIKYYKGVNDVFVAELLKNNKPLFFFDVDNTLTDFAFLSDEKKEYIGAFKEKDRIILSTGKVYQSILNVINDCKLNDSYSSCLNGSVVVYNNKFESISRVGSVSEEIVNEIEKTDITYILYYNNIIHVRKALKDKDVFNLKKYNEWYIDYEKPTRFDDIIKILCFIDEGNTAEEDVIRKIAVNYPELICVRTAGHTFEILRKDQHKGNTVKLISKRLNHYYRCSIGVGDSMNDLPMLNYVGIPFIVSTSSDELKSYKFIELEKNRNVDIVNLIKKYE